ncbi:MAG: hypothetical protein HDR15_02680 [Lachnospiraceae bacterium]|nr:hypothetical protein [Lachnospiraceae bacterium]
MKKYKNFKEYMQENYYNEIFEAIKGLVCRGKDSFEDDEIAYVKWVELIDFHVEGVTFKAISDDQLEIRVTADAEVEVEGKAGKDHDCFFRSKLYCVFFSGVLDDTLHGMRLLRAEDYFPSQYERDRSLSQNLVPYMYEEDIERHAEAFLKKYYPKALLQPMSLPADEILASMGMRMYYAPLENGIFGKTYFGEETVTVYDNILGSNPHEITTSPGTMLINPNVYFMYNIGTANNTIIHECVHWDRHRRPFALQKILNGNVSHISCEIVERYEGMAQDASALQWMEWQANQLAPRILMPADMTKRKLEETLNRLHAEFPLIRNAELLEKAVNELSLFFGVSNIAAKLRVVELGYDSAQGVQVYCDGRYLPPFSFPKGTLKLNQTFVIDEQNAMWAIFLTPQLRELFFAQKIVYANCMVCWNSPKYIQFTELGVPILTDYALEHVHKCCFIFDRKISASENYSDSFYRRCFLCRDVSSDTFIEATFDPSHENNQDKLQAEKEINIIVKAAAEMTEALANDIPGGFGGTLSYHMKHKRLTNEQLAERSNLSTVSISTYRNATNPKVEMGTALALCNGLKLQRYYGRDFMRKAGYDLDNPSPQNFIAEWLIVEHPDDTLQQWQEKINKAKIPIKIPGCT